MSANPVATLSHAMQTACFVGNDTTAESNAYWVLWCCRELLIHSTDIPYCTRILADLKMFTTGAYRG